MTKYAPYSAYEDTGLKWLGKVPVSWNIVPLWTLYTRGKTINFPTETLLSVYRDHGVVPKSSRTDNFNNPSDDLSAYQLVRSGDLVINKMKAWQGSVAISRHRGIVSPAYFVYDRHHNMDDRYLHYLLRSERYIAGYLSLSKGIRINQWDLDPTYHSRMPVLVPTHEEQQQIVELLDRETAQIDELIVKQERLIELLAEKRQAIITQAVTKGLDPATPITPSGIPWLGDIPAHWSLHRVSWLFDTISSGTTPPSESSDYYGGETNWVTTGELRERPITGTTKKVTQKALSDFSTLRVYPPGTILMAMYGATIGRLGVLAAPATVNQACCALASPRGVVDKFVFYALLAAKEHLIVIASGGGQPNINQDKVRSLRLAVPPTEEQARIVEMLDRDLNKLDTLVRHAQRAIELLKERRSALISAAVTGKIDVREGAA